MSQIFAVQDRTGTVAQLSLADPPAYTVALDDTGLYTGVNYNGSPVSYPFTVGQVIDDLNFCITTQTGSGVFPSNVLQSGWPDVGIIQWTSGQNSSHSPNESDVIGMVPANAYISTEYLAQYNSSRGLFTYPDSPIDTVWQAIVQATDYLDQRYRYKGIKLLQFLSNPQGDLLAAFIDPWLSPFGYTNAGTAWLEPSTTQQKTEWPRQGCVDFSGDTVYGIPFPVKYACAELALRVLNGSVLQPDYDLTNGLGGGQVASTITEEIGPLKTTTVYDTKFGLGFFPDFPHVTRILSRPGLLVAGGGRSIIR